MAVVAEAVDAKATVVRNALEALGDENALNALEAVLDLASLERELIEDGARRRTFALLQVQEGLSKLRVVDDVATIVDRAPRELVESCGFDRAVLFRVHEGRMVMESAYFGDGPGRRGEDGRVRAVGGAAAGSHAARNRR